MMKLVLSIALALFSVSCLDVGKVSAQSPIFDSLNRAGVGNGDLEQLRIANEMAEKHANSVAKRADLLSRHVNEMRRQNDQLRDRLEQLDRQLAKVKSNLELAHEQCNAVNLQLKGENFAAASQQLSMLMQQLSATRKSISDPAEATLKVNGPDPGAPPLPQRAIKP